MAQRACSTINGSQSCEAFSKAGRAEASPTFPKATQTFRNNPRRFVRKMGEPVNRDLKFFSSSESNPIKSGCATSFRACDFINLPSRANLFHGQTARQSSQP